jgi:hypothetical protein
LQEEKKLLQKEWYCYIKIQTGITPKQPKEGVKKMAKVFFDGQEFNINNGTTLKHFIERELDSDSGYLVNGEAKPLDTVLDNYSVIEESPDGTFLHEVAGASRPQSVEIELNDFTGFSGKVWVANNIAALRERYNQSVSFTVIRNNDMIRDPRDLQNGDKVIAMPSGGVKGA